VAAREHARGFDSVWIAFTKGLGCPVGAVLAGSAAFVREAWLLKRRWGGAMRQTGVLTAMCLFALDHHVARLGDDHALARSIGDRLAALPAVGRVLPVETNIVILDLADEAPDARETARRLRERDVTVTVVGRRRLRIVTHLDVGPADADALVAAMRAVV
jgi:threonine aldolase